MGVDEDDTIGDILHEASRLTEQHIEDAYGHRLGAPVKLTQCRLSGEAGRIVVTTDTLSEHGVRNFDYVHVFTKAAALATPQRVC